MTCFVPQRRRIVPARPAPSAARPLAIVSLSYVLLYILFSLRPPLGMWGVDPPRYLRPEAKISLLLILGIGAALVGWAVSGPESHENGKFAWIMDPDGNKIELWEPKNVLRWREAGTP